MTKTIYLTFDGQVFRPEEPIDLRPDTRVRATIEPEEAVQRKRGAFLDTAKSLNLQGPADWASRLEDYLYGVGGNAS
jgi:hypothetical protein